MKGWRLFRHAFRMVWDNRGTALRITGLLFAFQLVPQIWWQMQTEQTGLQGDVMVAPGLALVMALWALASVVTSIWLAVAWHRYVLTGEDTGSWLPNWHGGLVLGYLGRTILVGLVGIVAGFVFAVPLSIVLLVVPILFLPALLIYVAAVIFVLLRLSLILPAVAMEKRMKLMASWEVTGTDLSGVLGLAAILAVISAVVPVGALFFGAIALPLGLVWMVAASWLLTLISITCLTTLYGVYVEGRDIP
ncbi:hypothetical protein [Tropicibacter alexandrii]|uniref:hypothetical protein n=1 Tax=Tropicibacter alexandrii TaxID=2267683 RepID=UPI000EF540AC|nr:hypothetical protein [Tropicibacter alexandrii]